MRTPLQNLSSLALLLVLLLVACEVEYLPPADDFKEELVVEGFIEVGEEAPPIYVTITKTLPFVNTINSETIDSLFVKDALVTVSNGQKEVALQQVCLSDLPPEARDAIRQATGLLPNFPEFCLYLDLANEIQPETGKIYDLRIETRGRLITASTSIPEHVPITSTRFSAPPSPDLDSFAQLQITLSDPIARKDYYRYQTAVLPGPLTPGFATVTDDAFFNGETFEFPLQKTERPDSDVDTDEFGLFRRGDSILVKWCTIDRDHFNFWNTLEYNSNNQGPFSTYTRVESNVDGAYGIWGGYSCTYYRLRVPEN